MTGFGTPNAPGPRVWDSGRASEIIAAGAEADGALLPLLHALQAEFGCVPDDAVPLLASALNLSRAEVHGVVTFYPDFTRTPQQGRLIRVCRAEACQARGSHQVERALAEAFDVDEDAARRVKVEAVYCLGLCASGPAALIDGRPVARLTGSRLERLIAEARE